MKLIVKIPSHKDLLVTIGQTVDFSTPLLKKKAPKTNTVPIASVLGFPPEKIFLQLKKFVGDNIAKGDLIAEYKSFMSTKQYISEDDGVIREVSHESGSVIIETVSEDEDMIYCFFQGTVISIDDDRLELKVKEAKEYEIVQSKKYTGGPVSYQDGTHILPEDEVHNTFVCSNDIKPFDMTKLETLGACGFITLNELKRETSLPKLRLNEEHDYKDILKHKFPYCLVGEENKTLYFYE